MDVLDLMKTAEVIRLLLCVKQDLVQLLEQSSYHNSYSIHTEGHLYAFSHFLS